MATFPAAYDIALTLDHTPFVIDQQRLQSAIERILQAAGVRVAEISVAVIDDPTIHELNIRYLQHDYPTDVLSFPLEFSGRRLSGEIVVSADTAQRSAAEFGWPADDELLLYVVHGMLHLVGYDDHASEDRQAMRQREIEVLAGFGVEARYAETLD